MKPPFLFMILGVLALIAFAGTSTYLNQKEIWFSNLDQDSVLLINALRINDGRAPTYYDHPSQGVYIVYGGLFGILNKVGLSPLGKFSDLERDEDPVRLVPGLFYFGRGMSILVSILCALAAAASIYIYTGRMEYAAIGAIFLLASPGLLLQSLLIRSELTSVFFLCLAMPLLALVLRYPNRPSLFFLTGMMFGLAYVTKIQVLPFAAVIIFAITLSLTNRMPKENGSSSKVVRFLMDMTALGLLCALGFLVIGSFHLLYLLHVVHRALERTGVLPGMLISAGILFLPLLGVGIYSWLQNRPRFSRSADVLSGIGLIGFALALIASSTLLAILGNARDRPIAEVFQLPMWKVIPLSLVLSGLGGWVLWMKNRRSPFLKQVQVSGILMSGFFFGILASLVLCSGLADSYAAGATDSRLFNFTSMNEFSHSINPSSGSQSAAPSPSINPLIHEFSVYLWLYLSRNFLLSGYMALLIVTFVIERASPRYLWPSLVALATGLLFMMFSSIRWYTEQYWVYIDFFFMGAWAFLVFGVMERFNTLQIRIAVAALLGVLYATQYAFVAKTYPQYNIFYRDRIDEAAHAIYEVREYSGLMRERYGDNLEFMKRVLSDPDLNGSRDGIDLLSKPGVQRVIESTPENPGTFRLKD